MKRSLVFVFFMFCYLFLCEYNVEAYESFCKQELYSSEGIYRVCDKQVYLNKDDIDNSSYILADRYFKPQIGKILYAGVISGYETFYSTGFHYYSIVYDDRSFSNEDMYSDLSLNGVVVHSGEFSDNILLNQSGRYYVNYFNEPGTYIVRQYIGGKVVNYIKVVVVNKSDLDLGIYNVYYDNRDINEGNSLYVDNGTFEILFSGGKYGFGENVKLKINKCSFDKIFEPNLKIESSDFNECLFLNRYNSISVLVYDGLGRNKEFTYNFIMNSRDIVITMEDSASNIVTSSRRVIVKSSAGYGNRIDENYNLYYWSKNSSDNLTYEDFMSNYDKSSAKGVYSSNNGVILRNSSGSYYLYALAKDNLGNSVVVRSNEYVLKKHEALNKVTTGDVVLVVILCLCAAAPIFIYFIIRGKDTY